MSESQAFSSRVKTQRQARGWSQAELAERAGISRAAVSAIEINRLVPSVAAALALAHALENTVEELFGTASRVSVESNWAWPPPQDPCRYWQGNVAGHSWRYPVETVPLGEIPHDGVWRDGQAVGTPDIPAERTLVMACCDPAVGLLAQEYNRSTPYRLLAFTRSSGKALELLQGGLVHVAGVHLSAADDQNRNADVVRDRLGAGTRLIRLANWDEGLAVSPHLSGKSIQSLLKSRLSWVGREPGSGARLCLDQLLQGKSSPRRIAYDHRGVAESVRCGWADIGVCHRLTSEEAGLRFLPVRNEAYDLCYRGQEEHDPRLQALVRVVRSSAYRRILSELPGYSCDETGSMSVL